MRCGNFMLRPLFGMVVCMGTVAHAETVGAVPANAFEPVFSVTFDGTLVSVDLKDHMECEIPPFVKSISRTAFNGCSNLVSLTIPSTVTNIECAWAGPRPVFPSIGLSEMQALMEWEESTYSPFSDCANLRDVTVSQHVCDIGLPVVFGDAREMITNVVFDSGVTNIGTWTIETARTGYSWYADNKPFARIGCSNILCVTFSSDVIMKREWVAPVGSSLLPLLSAEPLGMFASSRLERAVFAEGVTSIGANAFDGCGNLVDVSISGSVRDIGEGAFFGCTNLYAVGIPAGVTNIGNWAFAGCNRLTHVIFDGNAPAVNSSAFGVMAAGVDDPCRNYVSSLSVGEGCRAYVRIGTTGWNVDIPGTWNGIQIKYLAPVLPQVLFDADLSSAQSAMSVFADPNVAKNATADIETYGEYVKWVDSVGIENAATSTTSWMSFALGSPTLIDVPMQGDLKIDDVAPDADGKSVDMLFSIDGVDVADTEAVVSRLNTVFEVYGAESIDYLKPVAPTFDVVGGKVKATVIPPDGADSYFMKVEVK